MPKIQARNIDEALYQRIELSAMKHERSLEGEIRIALRDYYTPVAPQTPALSLRERWQTEAGQRLRLLIQRLNEDGFDPRTRSDNAGVADFVHLGGQLGTSPGLLMDIAEGRAELTPETAGKLEDYCGTSGSWLLSGEGRMFPLVTLGTYSGIGWQAFFFPDGDDRYVFEFIRIEGGCHDGTLLILRQHEYSGHTTTGLVTEAFYLGAGMGGGGYGNLKTFLLFLKKHCAPLVMNAYVFTPPEPDFDFWSVMGQHHPVWFRNISQCSPSRWLLQLLSGEDPNGWFTEGWKSVLEEVAATPAREMTRDGEAQ